MSCSSDPGKEQVIPLEWLEQAVSRINPYIVNTPIIFDSDLNIYLKWENQQISGSFKIRGAFNKVLSMEKWELEAGLVTASAGNHGLGVALAGNQSGVPVTVFASNHAVPSKVQAMQNAGAKVELVDGGYEMAERTAVEFSKSQNQVWVSPYNDGLVIAGQGTIGLEILRDVSHLETMNWVVPIGGGGLLSGIGAALEQVTQRPRLLGIQSEASPFMHALYHFGSQDNAEDLPTLADGLSGAVESGSITIPMVKNYADDILLVSEKAIKNAIAYAWHHHGHRIEGSGAVGLAAVLENRVKSPAVVIVTGGNIKPGIHKEICEELISS
jgi:threonine dehydratase